MRDRGFTKEQRRQNAIKNENNMMSYRKKNIWPICIGKFPECKEYTIEMVLKDRPECTLCPWLNGK